MGVTKNGTVLTTPVDDLHWYIDPTVTYEIRNMSGGQIQHNENIEDMKTVRVAMIKSLPTQMVAGTKTYITPFTPEVAYSALKMARGSITDQRDGHSVSIMKAGRDGGIGFKGVPNAEKLWAEGNFEEIYERYSKPQKSLILDPADLDEFLKFKKARQSKEDPYG